VLTTRRTTVAVALAGGAALAGGLSGCDIGDPARPGASPGATPAADPDEELLDRARTEVDAALALVTALSRHGRMATPLAPLLALHTAHRDALAGDDTPTETPTETPTGTPAPPSLSGAPGELWTMLLARERTLHRRLAVSAVEASSGTLARLLASMSAGIAAHVAAARADAGVAW
jgi:hypothetical protein